MSKSLVVPINFQDLTDQTEVVNVEGNTVGECLIYLVNQFPELRAQLFTERGQLSNNISIYVNLEDSYPEGLSMPVNNGDKLHLVLSGGCCG